MARAPAVQEAEEVPEADRLDGFPHPRMTTRLYGHEAAEETLAAAFAADRLHHGWLLTGLEGIGKATLAYRLARYLLAQPEERAGKGLAVGDETVAARQVRALSHPGLLVIRRVWDPKAKRFPASITIDEVRRLKAFLARTMDRGQWRAVIVDRADELNVNAANALLKSLEEPPPRTVFLLVSQSPGRLLTTLRSRVRLLELAPLGADALKQAIAQAFAASGEEITASPPLPSEWPRLEELSGGSVRRLISLHAEKGIQLYDRMASLIATLPKVDWTAVHMLSDELQGTAQEQRFELFYDLLLTHLSRIIRAKAIGADGETQRLAERLIGPARLASWASMWERVAAEKAEAMALNLDRKALILDTFAKLEAAASGR